MGDQVQQLATDMGVSPADAAAFVEGVRVQMRRGLGLVDAIKAHLQFITAAYEHMARRAGNAQYSERMRGFVVDTFFPAAALSTNEGGR